jgi:hypothetical protein
MKTISKNFKQRIQSLGTEFRQQLLTVLKHLTVRTVGPDGTTVEYVLK